MTTPVTNITAGTRPTAAQTRFQRGARPAAEVKPGLSHRSAASPRPLFERIRIPGSNSTTALKGSRNAHIEALTLPTSG